MAVDVELKNPETNCTANLRIKEHEHNPNLFHVSLMTRNFIAVLSDRESLLKLRDELNEMFPPA